MTDLLLVSMSEIKESAFVTLSGGTERVCHCESMVMPKKIKKIVGGMLLSLERGRPIWLQVSSAWWKAVSAWL